MSEVDRPAPVPYRMGRAAAAPPPPGWPPDVAPNQIIAASHINSIRSSVYAWPGDVDGMNHVLSNVQLENVTGVMTDPTIAPGDLIARDLTAPVRLPIGTHGQLLSVDDAQPTKLKWITPVPTVSSVFGRTGVVAAQSGDYTAAQVTNAVSTLGSYNDPPWLTGINWAKVTSAPATFPPSAHTHDAAAVVSGRFDTARLGTGIADATVYLRGDGAWAPAAGGGGGGAVTSVFGRAGVVVAQTGDYTAAQVSGAVVDPTVSLGDLMVRGTTTIMRFPLGANGMVLQADNTQPGGLRWTEIGGGSGIPSGLTNGDILQWMSGAWAILPVGAIGQVLTVDTGGNGLRWAVGAGGSQTPWIQDIDGGNHALTNTSVIVSNGSIRSTSGGFIFPDGSTQTSAYSKAASQTPWTQNIDAAGFNLNNASNLSAHGVLPLIHNMVWSDGWKYVRDGCAMYINNYGVGIDFSYAVSGIAGSPCAPSPLMSFRDNNVGIGDTNPTMRLAIQPATVSAPVLGDATKSTLGVLGDTGLWGLYVGALPSGHSWLQAMRGDSAQAYNILLNPVGGNVGIGTTNPLRRLQVAEDQTRQLYLTSSSDPVNKQMRLGYDTSNNTGVVEVLLNGAGQPLSLNPAGGNVGIGTANPTHLLQLQCSGTTARESGVPLFFARASGSSFAGIGISGVFVAGPLLYCPPGTDDWAFGFDNGSALEERMRVKQNGNVGIGTADPQCKLQVNGQGQFSNTTPDVGWGGAGLMIRENNLAGAMGGNMAYAPRIHFHWSGTGLAPGIGCNNDGAGTLRTFDSVGNYAPFACGSITSAPGPSPIFGFAERAPTVNSTFTIWVNPAANQLNFIVRYANGTHHYATIALTA